jgi:hypothetical protein
VVLASEYSDESHGGCQLIELSSLQVRVDSITTRSGWQTDTAANARKRLCI